jgi:hypothetical protein
MSTLDADSSESDVSEVNDGSNEYSNASNATLASGSNINSSAAANGAENLRNPSGTVVPVVLVLLCMAGFCVAVLHHRRKHHSAAAAAAARELGGAQIVEMMHNPLRNNANQHPEATPGTGDRDDSLNGDGSGGNADVGGYLHVMGAIDRDAAGTLASSGGGRGDGGGGGSDRSSRQGCSGTRCVVSTSISNPHMVFSIPMEEDGGPAVPLVEQAWVSGGGAAYAEIENYAAPPQNAAGAVAGAEAEYEEIENYDAPPHNPSNSPAPATYSVPTDNTELYHSGNRGKGSAVKGSSRAAEYAAADGSEQMYVSGPVEYAAADGSEMMYEVAGAAPQSEA